MERVLELGVVLAARALWEELSIGPAIRRCTEQAKLTAPHETALFAMAANRLDDPVSKLACAERWNGAPDLSSREQCTFFTSNQAQQTQFLPQRGGQAVQSRNGAAGRHIRRGTVGIEIAPALKWTGRTSNKGHEFRVEDQAGTRR